MDGVASIGRGPADVVAGCADARPAAKPIALGSLPADPIQAIQLINSPGIDAMSNTAASANVSATQVVCHRCDGIVRVPTDRQGDQPKCPRCHEPLFTGHPVELNSAGFDRQVSQSGVPVVVDFWAPWCGPCRSMAPVFERIAAETEPAARFAKLNTDEAQDIAARYGIRSIPTLMVFKDGREIARQAGAMDAASMRRWLQANAGIRGRG
jgi:thioredoxin 2